MERLLIAAAIVVVVAVVAIVARRRRPVDVPTQRRFAVPEQLDRSVFPRPEAPWLVAVFSSATCDVCQSVVAKAEVLASDDVAVAEVEYGADRALHDQYTIEAVPTTVVADRRGVVVASFLGPVTATDLWAAVAEARQPGSTPGACHH
jgi:hypothetical protein